MESVSDATQNKQERYTFCTPSLDTILASRIVFIGESIHGVAEFSQFKKELIKHINGRNWIVLFEACKYPCKTAHSLLEIFRHTDYVP